MGWLYYLLEANLYLILFYGFYRLLLHRETFYALNRYYLIFSSILAFILPFFQLGFLKTAIIDQINMVPTETVNPVQITGNITIEPDQPSIFTFDNIIITIYALITIAFLLKMLFGLSKIIKMFKLPSVKLDNGVKLIDLNNSKIAFSFFNLLFLDPLLPEKNTIIKHELVHIKQRHSLDVLLFEIIQIINWFNPFSYLIKKDIKLIHEYLADEETTKNDVEKYHYAMFLIQNSTGTQHLTLTNQIFSSSLLKKRISMLNQKKSARWARLKLLLVLPITAGILCISTMAFTKDYGFVDLLPQKTVIQDTVKKIKGLLSPVVKSDNQTSFYPKNEYSHKTNEAVKFEKRYIVINGKPVKDNRNFHGVRNTKSVKYLNQKEAVKKYGIEKGKNGAIEISGDNIQYAPKISPPPPIDANNKLKKVALLSPPTGSKENNKSLGLKKEAKILPPPPKIESSPSKTQKPATITLSPDKLKSKKESVTYSMTVPITLELNRSKGDKLTLPSANNETISLIVLDRWGTEIYKNADYKNDWQAKEDEIKPGPYYYVQRIKGKEDTIFNKGFFQIK